MSSTPALTWYLVRHGRTRYNDEVRLQGWCDSDLTDDGWAGVRATARALAAVPFVAAWSSPSGRTVATAQEILQAHPDVALTCDDDLMEFSFGEYEARPERELWAIVDPVALFAGLRDGSDEALPGGESGAVYQARVQRAFGRIEAAHPEGGAVLVVSHGVTLLTHLTQRGIEPATSLPNASVTVVRSGPDGHEVVRFGWDPSGLAVPGQDLAVRAAVPGKGTN
jgi:probable phosphoglycerate mutase